MKNRSGRDIFIQHVERIYADRAPSIYFVDTHFRDCGMVYDVIIDVVNNLPGNYRQRIALIDQSSSKDIFGVGRYQWPGVKGNTSFINDIELTPDMVINTIAEMGNKSGLKTDRNLFVFTAFHEKFSDPRGIHNHYGLIDFDLQEIINANAKKSHQILELVPIYQTSYISTSDPRFNPEYSVIVQTFDGVEFITLFGGKPDEVYMFAYRSTYEPIPISVNINYEYAQKVIEHAENRRMMMFGSYSEYNLNPFTGYMPGISAEAYHAIPQYAEKYTLLDAANTPFDEVLKLAERVDNGLSVFSNSGDNPKTDGIVEEAGAAWREGKYASLSDSVQPGFSRSGTFTYRSALLGGLTVISYNLLLQKEKS